MARIPRSLSESGIYHVMFRGTNKQPIFLNDRDYEKLLEGLIEIKQIIPYDMYAYCLMTNHVHFVIKENSIGDISKIMHRLLTKYARWFNIKYERTGTLLEGRYRSKPVTTDEYFLHLVRYVHQNPIKANIVLNIDEYPWSSYCDYVDKNESWIEKSFMEEVLPISQFESFHAEEELDDFELFDTDKKNDKDLIETLKRCGIESGDALLALKYTDADKFAMVVNKLKSKFSERHIERVTGITRHKLKV